ncbi:Uncharacterised protein [Grimontia hollisae]|nr:Uncharacterised protein [Grimontia hollisae]
MPKLSENKMKNAVAQSDGSFDGQFYYGYMDSPVRQTSARLLKLGFGLPLYIRPFTDSRHGPDDIARLQCLIR